MSRARSWSIKEIDLVSLRLFAAAVDEGVLARTSERENVAISAISRRISDLELRCGVTLLERHDRGVKPTAAGEMLAEHIRGILSQIERMVLDMESVRGGTSGHIRIHAHMSATLGLLPEKIGDFMAANPKIDILLEEFTSAEVLHAVRAGTADLGVVSGPVDSDDLYFIPWLHDELVAVLRIGHPLLAHETLTFSDLVREPFIGMQRNGTLMNLYRRQAAAQGCALIERAHATSFESAEDGFCRTRCCDPA